MTTNDNKTTAYIVRLPEGRIYEMVRILRDISSERIDCGDTGSDTDLILEICEALDNAKNLSEECEHVATGYEMMTTEDTNRNGTLANRAYAIREFAKLF